MTVDITIFAVQIVILRKLKHKKTVIVEIRSGPGRKTKETLCYNVVANASCYK